MGSRGPAPTPSALLKARGSHWSCTRKNEVSYAVTLPQCPEWLDTVAKKKWYEVSQLLFDAKILTEIDRDALARYCQLWSLWLKAYKDVLKNGFKIKTVRGYVKSPAASMITSFGQDLARLEAQFGLTPSARTNFKKANGEKSDKEKGKFFIQTG